MARGGFSTSNYFGHTGFTLSSAEKVAFSVWLKTNQSETGIICGIRNGDSGAGNWTSMRIDHLDHFQFAHDFFDVGTIIAGTSTITDDAWHHGFCYYNGSVMTIYTNGGAAEATSGSFSGVLTVTGTWTIGRRNDVADEGLDGEMAELAMWKGRTFTQGEIDALAAGYSPLFFKDGMEQYYSLLGDSEIDPIQGRSLTENGTIGLDDHPAIIYPTTKIYIPGASTPAPEFDFLQAATDTSNTDVYTFSAQNLGAADTDRKIIVAAMSRKAGATTTISSITVGGESATIVQQQSTTDANTNVSGLAIAAVPTGTTGDVVVTFADGMVRCAIGLYRVVGITSETEVDSGGSSDAAPTYDIDVPAGGFAIGAALTAAETTASWTGLTEDYDATLETFVTYTGASDEFVGAQTDLTVTATFASASESSGVFASWGLGEVVGTPLPEWPIFQSRGFRSPQYG